MDTIIGIVMALVIYGLLMLCMKVLKKAIYTVLGTIKIIEYRRMFPIDEAVEMNVKLELMSVTCHRLSEEEESILKDKKEMVNITRDSKNRLIIKQKECLLPLILFERTPWEIYNGENKELWVDYFKKGFFQPKNTLKRIIFKAFMKF